MKNRTRETCTSGTVRDEGGNILIYSANDRGDRGNVGIIRSPIRASILPDLTRHARFGNFAVQLSAETHSGCRQSPAFWTPLICDKRKSRP